MNFFGEKERKISWPVIRVTGVLPAHLFLKFKSSGTNLILVLIPRSPYWSAMKQNFWDSWSRSILCFCRKQASWQFVVCLSLNENTVKSLEKLLVSNKPFRHVNCLTGLNTRIQSDVYQVESKVCQVSKLSLKRPLQSAMAVTKLLWSFEHQV